MSHFFFIKKSERNLNQKKTTPIRKSESEISKSEIDETKSKIESEENKVGQQSIMSHLSIPSKVEKKVVFSVYV